MSDSRGVIENDTGTKSLKYYEKHFDVPFCNLETYDFIIPEDTGEGRLEDICNDLRNLIKPQTNNGSNGTNRRRKREFWNTGPITDKSYPLRKRNTIIHRHELFTPKLTTPELTTKPSTETHTETKHVFELLFQDLYKFWESDPTIRAIASRYGIFIGFHPQYSAGEMLVDIIVDLIQKYKGREDEIQKIVNMGRKEFRDIVKDEYSEELYQNRLVYLSDLKKDINIEHVN
jgi:hypothetical protein